MYVCERKSFVPQSASNVYKLIIAYDGSDYSGWQAQPNKPTVAGTLQDRFKDVFKNEITLIGASRTDTGVHALGQVASFSLDRSIPEDRLLWAWNNSLPQDIVIRSLTAAPADFHPRALVEEKTYYYHFFEERPLPFVARFGYYTGPIDKEKLLQGLQVFVGTHDFRSFCTGYQAESTIRTINSIELVYSKRFGAYSIIVKGPGFLRYMIRRIVGACLDVASAKGVSQETLLNALAAKSPQQHFCVAPPSGLMLYEIHYKQ